MQRILTGAGKVMIAEQEIYDAAYEYAICPDDGTARSYLRKVQRRNAGIVPADKAERIILQARDRVEEVDRLASIGIYV